MALSRWIGIVAGTAALASAVPAFADVKAGVDAWSRGDWKAAVAEWRGPAEANDPDALFNMGQAYRLGRGVPKDEHKAREYYARAAKLGHVRAADTLGILMFQEGDREAAMPYIKDAARRGDPRSEYLLGIALFNGDLLPKDWVRAYALLTLANSQGLPQAAAAISKMDKYIPLDQRQQAATLAVKLQNDADAARARELAAVDLALRGGEDAPSSRSATVPSPSSNARLPQPIQSVAVAPSVEKAREAVHEAMLATGTESPAEAGADYARPAVAAPRQEAPRQEVASAPPPQAPTQHTPPPAPKPVARASTAASGPWKVQLGVFSVSDHAERLWNQIEGRPEVSGKNRLLVPAGRLTKLLAGGYATRDQASAACQRLKQAGHDCLVTK